jgi:hypothetical protein
MENKQKIRDKEDKIYQSIVACIHELIFKEENITATVLCFFLGKTTGKTHAQMMKQYLLISWILVILRLL